MRHLFCVALALTCSSVAQAQPAATPPLEGLSQPLPGWSYGKVRQDYFKYKSEKPLYSISAGNVERMSCP